VLRCEVDEPRSYALALVSAVRLCVDDKGMVSTVRYDVDEADETPAGVGDSDPAEAVWTGSIPPADLGVSARALTSSTISASVNGPRQRYVTPSETNCGRTAGEAKNNQIIQLCLCPSGDIREHCPSRPPLLGNPCGALACLHVRVSTPCRSPASVKGAVHEEEARDALRDAVG